MIKALWLVLILCLIGCENKDKTTLETTDKKPTVLENFRLTSNDGTWLIINQKPPKNQNNFKNIEPKKENMLKNIIINNNKNTVTMIFFFTTWCEPCNGILPHLDNLKQQFGDQIAMYGIPVDDLVGETENFKEAIKVYIKDNNITLPLILDDNRTMFLNTLNSLDGVPLIALYDNNGSYIIHYLGAVPEEMMEFDLTQNIAKLKAK